MTRAFVGVVLLASVFSTAQSPDVLSPLERCQTENLQTKELLIRMQQRAINAEAEVGFRELAKLRAELEPTLRERLKCTTPGFDWVATACTKAQD